MCSRFETHFSSDKIQSELSELKIKTTFQLDHKWLPYQEAPVLVKENENLKLVKMKFSLVPSWSESPKVKFATHNARIESVLEKPTWKIPFLSQHCVVPMTGFYESVYEGPHQGHMIQFVEKSGEILFAAGIFDYWSKDSNIRNHFFSFSILTTEPSDFILKNGHDRCPIFLRKNHIKDWCELKSKDYAVVKEKLLSWSYSPDLVVKVERQLKPGWEKRI